MKKIIIGFMVVILLSGCAKEEKDMCTYNIEEGKSLATSNYENDIKTCEKVNYVYDEYDLKIETVPGSDKAVFTMNLYYKDKVINNKFTNVEFMNADVAKVNGNIFVKLVTGAQDYNIYLIVFDKDGNVLKELERVNMKEIEDDLFKVLEYNIYSIGGYNCSEYEDKEQVAYMENVYSTSTLELIGSTEYKIKDVCYHYSVCY